MKLLDAVQIKRLRLTVEQYHRMLEAGVIAPDARVELIEGNVVEMAAIGPRHHAAAIRLARLLAQTLDGRAVVSTKLSIQLDEMTETRPDLTIYKPRHDFRANALPTGADALLVIEISDTKLDYDVRVKGPLYARHGVPAYWIFDLPARALRYYRAPRGDAYTEVMALETPDVVTLPGLNIRVDLAGVL
jgi:Uma2 family endonuclease